MRFAVPRVVVAGLSGDGGKTLVSLGLARALSARGTVVRAFKKGPDYIDPAWLTAAAGAPCRSLDAFLMSPEAIASSAATARDANLMLVEGNRGLFDGVDAAGKYSTAELAKQLAAPVVLVVNTTKMTRTVAALVLGCRNLDPALRLAGVILNQVGTSRQEHLIRRAVEDATGVPVIGAVSRIVGDDPLPGRHLGLVTYAEHPAREAAIEQAADAVAQGVDLSRILELAATAPSLELVEATPQAPRVKLRIAYFEDQVFSFYYPENLEALQAAGATLVPVSPLSSSELPQDVDALYIGGGFPEVHAPRLADNNGFAASIRRAADDGLPIYAECGGLMYLARELVVEGVSHPMSGVLDLVIVQEQRPQGHGYVVGVVDGANPYFPTGTELRGHEFHYSRVVGGGDRDRSVLALSRGAGCGEQRDGLVRHNVWASYLHLHAKATPGWAHGFIDQAARYVSERTGRDAAWA